jgi:hypothetical protein
MGNEHPDQSGKTKFYAHVDTPVGHVQQDDYAFLLKFSEPVWSFTQHFAVDDSSAGSDSVVITPGQNRISGDPYTFNFDGLVENGNVQTDAWYCTSSDNIQSAAASCLGGSVDSDTTTAPVENHEMPDWDCDTYGICVVKYDVDMTISDAREACDSHNGVLPRPWNSEENEALAAIGSTWIEMYVNEKINVKYENFTPRLRPYLNAENDGLWDIKHGSENLPFFCVQPAAYEGCENVFRSDNLGHSLFDQGGEWRMGEETFDQSDADSYDQQFRFELGTQIQYKCNRKLQNYKPWRKQSKMVQIKCVRMENGDFDFAECNSRNCDMFNRRPWLNDKIFNSTPQKNPLFC